MKIDKPEQQAEAVLLEYINATPAMQSLLYDLDLMPEEIIARSPQWHESTTDWRRMLIIASAWRAQSMIVENE